MRFQRFERYEPVVMTTRRQSAFCRKQEKERAKYPLFSDEIAAQQVGLEGEQQRRQVRRDSSEAQMRAFHARVWREARALYFRQPQELRAKIRHAWIVWTGPCTATYFSSLVDVMSGEQARRLVRIEVEQRPYLEAARARLRSGVTLSLFS